VQVSGLYWTQVRVYNGILNLPFVECSINLYQRTLVSCFRIKILHIRFEVLVVVTVKVAVFEV